MQNSATTIAIIFLWNAKIGQNYFSARPPLFLKLNLLKVHNDSTPKICALPRAQPSPNPRPPCLPLGCGANVGGSISLIGAWKHFFGGWVEKGEEKGEKGGEANVHTYVYKPVSVHTLIHIRRYFFVRKASKKPKNSCFDALIFVVFSLIVFFGELGKSICLT